MKATLVWQQSLLRWKVASPQNDCHSEAQRGICSPRRRKKSVHESHPGRARFQPCRFRPERDRASALAGKQIRRRDFPASPEDWRWSSCRFYSLDELGTVGVNEGWRRFRCRIVLREEPYGLECTYSHPSKNEGRGTLCPVWVREIKGSATRQVVQVVERL